MRGPGSKNSGIAKSATARSSIFAVATWASKSPAVRNQDVLGQHFEDMAGAFDQVSAILATVRSAENLVAETRRSIEGEFEERRKEQAELAALRGVAVQAPLDLADARRSEAAAKSQLSEAVAELEALRAARATLDTRVSEITDECVQLKATLAAERKTAADMAQTVQRLNTHASHMEDDLASARAQVQALESRRRDAEAAAAAAERARSLLDADLAAVRRRHDQCADDLLRTNRRLVEAEATLAAEQARAVQLAEDLAASNDRAGKLALKLEQQAQAAASQAQLAESRLETLQSRTERQEEQITELARLADELTTRERSAARDLTEATLMRDRANERARQAQEKLAALEAEAATASTARQAAVARADELTRLRQLNQAELDRFAERDAALRQALQTLDQRAASERTEAEARIKEISAELERERSERAVVEGALDSLRKDRTAALARLARYDAGLSEADVSGSDFRTS